MIRHPPQAGLPPEQTLFFEMTFIMQTPSWLPRLTLLLPLAALTACASHVAPLAKPAMPASQWQAALPGPALQAQGWSAYASPELLRLQALALADNPGWQAALSRVAQARATLAGVQGSQQPQLSVDGARSSSQSRLAGQENHSESWQAGVSLAYEVDLWGRLAAGNRAAQADLAASQFAADASRLVLETDVASAYFRLCLLDERVALNQDDLALAGQILTGLQGRLRVGSASALDLSQQEQLLATLQASRASLLAQRYAALTALAILVGQPPQGFQVRSVALANIQPALPALSQPASVLTRRPDIRQAEANLAVADADVDAAKAAFFPRLTLSARSAWSAAGSGPAGLAASLLAGLSAPLWDGGQLNASLQRNAARRDELTAAYRSSLLTALKESEDALEGWVRQQERDAALARAQEAAERSLRLSQGKLRIGSLDQLSLLSVQRSWVASRDSRAQSRFDSLQSSLTLYKALGGSWQP